MFFGSSFYIIFAEGVYFSSFQFKYSQKKLLESL